MSSYPYDDILQRHLEAHTKVAFLPGIAAGARAAFSAVPKFFGLGRAAGAAGAGAASAAGTVGAAGAQAPGMFGRAFQGVKNVAGKAFSLGTGIPTVKGSTPYALGGAAGHAMMAKQNSLREKTAAVYQFKSASSEWLHHAAHAAPYVGWLASQAADATGHHRLAKGLSAASYLGYAGASAHDAMTNPKERITGAVDTAALLAMLASDVARWRRDRPPT